MLPLSAQQLQLVSTNPLTITGNAQTSIAEWSSGAFVRADTYVYRMSPSDTASVTVYAMQWGKALASASVGFPLDSSGLQPTSVGPGQPYVEDGPPVAVPPDILKTGANPFTGNPPPTVTTDARGRRC